jgi:hypothetical protein
MKNMKLSQFINKLISLEMKNSECYLWCSINFQDLELRQFFSDMSDEELKHARFLTDISQSPDAGLISMPVPQDLPDKLVAAAAKIADAIKTEKNIDRCFLLVAQLECTELNVIYDSILKHFGSNKKAGFLTMNTKVHIKMLKEAAETFVTSPQIRKKIEALQVKDRDYYRVFSE